MSEVDGSFPPIDQWRRSIAAYAKLVRVPNLFTAPPDVVLGAAIVSSFGYAVRMESVAALAVASMLLYAAGTTLNDYFDAEEDAQERPERPIPSGDISRKQALIFGAALLVTGVGVAFLSGGSSAAAVAAILALGIVLYDGAFKGSVPGYLLMGGNRGINVVLGMAAAAVPTVLPARAYVIPGIIVLYIGSVTYMAESETGGTDRLAVSVGVAGTSIAAFGVVGAIAVSPVSAVGTVLTVTLLVGFLIWAGRPLRTAYVNPSPETIGPAIGACVLGLTILTAAFAATAGIRWSIAAIVFFIPAVGLSRVFDVS
ncbi:UbiA prenyltransferase [Halorubrum saccharovorum DSM 1137]|mgnify:CR=1 FL=1|uniref:UbiA prenyltransferase n=1 Tax=Halorubrum saccharovorum DSM 1137 TaxID=1227484 RepID=M0DNT4_9EURY|nr:UbiA family prenyltransferase [Halorubrum saccharovorum]ELZ36372.1 UbiA prenyltransferase [Halorubrum saccharovorum DSM 1137]